MATEHSGSLMVFKISEDAGVTKKRLVCEISDGVQTTNALSEKESRCGTFTAIKSAKYVYSGTAICNMEPSVSEVSFADVQQYQKAKTKLWFEYQNEASTDVTEGAGVYNQGYGYFTDSNLTANDGEVIEFTWSFSATGNVDLQSGAGS